MKQNNVKDTVVVDVTSKILVASASVIVTSLVNETIKGIEKFCEKRRNKNTYVVKAGHVNNDGNVYVVSGNVI